MVLEKTSFIKQEIYTLKCKNEDITFKLKNLKETNESLINESETIKSKYKKLKESSILNTNKIKLSNEDSENIKKILEDNKEVIFIFNFS